MRLSTLAQIVSKATHMIKLGLKLGKQPTISLPYQHESYVPILTAMVIYQS